MLFLSLFGFLPHLDLPNDLLYSSRAILRHSLVIFELISWSQFSLDILLRDINGSSKRGGGGFPRWTGKGLGGGGWRGEGGKSRQKGLWSGHRGEEGVFDLSLPVFNWRVTGPHRLSQRKFPGFQFWLMYGFRYWSYKRYGINTLYGFQSIINNLASLLISTFPGKISHEVYCKTNLGQIENCVLFPVSLLLAPIAIPLAGGARGSNGPFPFSPTSPLSLSQTLSTYF